MLTAYRMHRASRLFSRSIRVARSTSRAWSHRRRAIFESAGGSRPFPSRNRARSLPRRSSPGAAKSPTTKASISCCASGVPPVPSM